MFLLLMLYDSEVIYADAVGKSGQKIRKTLKIIAVTNSLYRIPENLPVPTTGVGSLIRKN
jgi:hypothetical protein